MQGVDSYLMTNSVELRIRQGSQDLEEGGHSQSFSVWLAGQQPSGDVELTLTLSAANNVALTLDPSEPLTLIATSSSARLVNVTLRSAPKT